jgi:isocitrate/isopropylmalate dehydrogenase
MMRWIGQTKINIVELMKTYHIALFLADGIGPEVVAFSRQVLEKLKTEAGFLHTRPEGSDQLLDQESFESTEKACVI